MQILLLSGDIERNPGWDVSVAPNYLQDFVKSLHGQRIKQHESCTHQHYSK